MAGQRQPTELVLLRGKKHFTKAEIEARKNAEVVAPSDEVKPPKYLTKKQKTEFRKLAKELLKIKLIANIDCDALARLIVAQEQYIQITKQIEVTPLMIEAPLFEKQINPETKKEESVKVGVTLVVNDEKERLLIIQDRLIKQCRQGASDFGLTISSRCRLVVPKKEEKPENKFAKYAT